MKIPHLIILAALALTVTMASFAADPTATSFSFDDCQGSLKPYPADIPTAEYPDSLVPVFINHVGRHGSRYPASAANCLTLQKALAKADSLGCITPLGKKLRALNDKVIATSNGRWGALDSLGIAEQAAIATRTFYECTEVLGTDKTVKAISSYSPRAMMSMYAFLHQLDRLNNRLTFETSTGRINSPLMRPFDTDKDYLEFRREKIWEPPYNEYFFAFCPTTAIERVLGEKYPFADRDEQQSLAITEYYVIAGLEAMEMESQMETYFTADEANRLWSCFNLRQYLQRAASTISAVPADIAALLVKDLIETTDAIVNGTDTETAAIFRFGHAETLMPLLSLLKIPGCYYLTNYFDTVPLHWQDFNIVPMAANFRIVAFKHIKTGRYFVRLDLNEQPIQLRKGDDAIYFPWGEVRRYMNSCLPLIMQ